MLAARRSSRPQHGPYMGHAPDRALVHAAPRARFGDISRSSLGASVLVVVVVRDALRHLLMDLVHGLFSGWVAVLEY